MNFLDFYKTNFQYFLIFSKTVFKLNQINVKIAKNSLNFKVFSKITVTCLYYLLKNFKILKCVKFLKNFQFFQNFHKVFLKFFKCFLNLVRTYWKFSNIFCKFYSKFKKYFLLPSLCPFTFESLATALDTFNVTFLVIIRDLLDV